MIVTTRDRAVLTEASLHQVITRHHLLAFGYFTSPQRANARLLALVRHGYLRKVSLSESLESRRHLYAATHRAGMLLGGRVERLVKARPPSPRLLFHSLEVLDVRAALTPLGLTSWLAEPQVRHRFRLRTGGLIDFRPDGLAVFGTDHIFIEADRSYMSQPRMRERFESYRAYQEAGVFAAMYHQPAFSLLLVTSGPERAAHLRSMTATLPIGVTVLPRAEAMALTDISGHLP